MHATAFRVSKQQQKQNYYDLQCECVSQFFKKIPPQLLMFL